MTCPASISLVMDEQTSANFAHCLAKIASSYKYMEVIEVYVTPG